MAGQKSGLEFAAQYKRHNLVLTSDVPLPLSPLVSSTITTSAFFCNCSIYEVYRHTLCLAKNGSISLGVQDILPWVTVERLLKPLLVEGVPANQSSTFFFRKVTSCKTNGQTRKICKCNIRPKHYNHCIA